MKHGVLALTLLLGAALPGCGPPTESAASDCTLAGATVLHAHGEDRFCVVVAQAGSPGELRAQVEPRAPWKLATEFPHRLDLGSGETRTTLGPEQAQEADEKRVAFVTPLASLARRDSPVAGRISFGVCQTDAICQRVDHRFEIAPGGP